MFTATCRAVVASDAPFWLVKGGRAAAAVQLSGVCVEDESSRRALVAHAHGAVPPHAKSSAHAYFTGSLADAAPPDVNSCASLADIGVDSVRDLFREVRAPHRPYAV